MSLINVEVILKNFEIAESAACSMQDVMQEFATNGYVSDDINRFSYATAPPPSQTPPPAMQQQQQMHLPLGRNPQQAASANMMPLGAPLTAHWLQSYREQLSNVWRHISYMPAATTVSGLQAQAAAAMSPNIGGVNLGLPLQPEQVRNGSNLNNNNTNKMHKRFNNKAKEVRLGCILSIL